MQRPLHLAGNLPFTFARCWLSISAFSRTSSAAQGFWDAAFPSQMCVCICVSVCICVLEAEVSVFQRPFPVCQTRGRHLCISIQSALGSIALISHKNSLGVIRRVALRALLRWVMRSTETHRCTYILMYILCISISTHVHHWCSNRQQQLSIASAQIGWSWPLADLFSLVN